MQAIISSVVNVTGLVLIGICAGSHFGTMEGVAISYAVYLLMPWGRSL